MGAGAGGVPHRPTPRGAALPGLRRSPAPGPAGERGFYGAAQALHAQAQPANLEACLVRSKPRGIRCARKLRLKRKKERWADAKYAKRNSGNWIKANPFAGSSHAKGIVLEKMCAPAPRPLRRRAAAAGRSFARRRRPGLAQRPRLSPASPRRMLTSSRFVVQWLRGQAAELCHSEVLPCAAHQERQEDFGFRPQRRLPELRR